MKVRHSLSNPLELIEQCIFWGVVKKLATHSYMIVLGSTLVIGMIIG